MARAGAEFEPIAPAALVGWSQTQNLLHPALRPASTLSGLLITVMAAFYHSSPSSFESALGSLCFLYQKSLKSALTVAFHR